MRQGGLVLRQGAPFWKAPDKMAMLAIGFVVYDAKDDAEMQQERGGEKFARHLWILHIFRGAGRTGERAI